MADKQTSRRHHGAAGAIVGAVLVASISFPIGAGATAKRAISSSPDAALHTIAECLNRGGRDVGVSGLQVGRFTADVVANEVVDAQTAMWLQVNNWPVSFSGGAGAGWLGGRVIGTYPQKTPWADFHHTGGLNFQNERMTIAGLRVHNYGDGIRVRDGARDFRITGVHLSFMHDDCVENDQLYSGTVEDSLLDGCYVAFSARPSSGDNVDGRNNTYTIQHNVVRLKPTPTVYKGKAPGHGGFFKWDEGGRAPKLVVRDNVFRVDQRPNHQTLGLPSGYRFKCSNNVVVWLGKGRYPDHLPKCFKVTRDRRVWDRAVAAWNAAHPMNP